jgi:hypothetical protein
VGEGPPGSAMAAAPQARVIQGGYTDWHVEGGMQKPSFARNLLEIEWAGGRQRGRDEEQAVDVSDERIRRHVTSMPLSPCGLSHV